MEEDSCVSDTATPRACIFFESDSCDFRKSGTRYLILTGVSMRRKSNVYPK